MEFKYVKAGRENPETEAVQVTLKEEGYDVEVTKVCDAKTVAAIKKFQEKEGLKVDGIVGKYTWIKLISHTKAGVVQFCLLIVKRVDWEN